jgi:hypothetical protein
MVQPGLIAMRSQDESSFRHKVEAHYTHRGLTLPRVKLEQIGKNALFGVRFSVHDADAPQKKVGVCSIDEYRSNGKVQKHFSSINIDEYPAQGYGVATYTEAICMALAQDKDFRTDPILGLSKKSASMWCRLIDLGLAVELGPLIPATEETDIHWDVVVPAINNENHDQI